MRKSRYVTILLAGASLAACDQSKTPQDTVYGSVDACAHEHDPQQCQSAYDSAKAEHTETAPKYHSSSECWSAGNSACEEVQRVDANGVHYGTGLFMPMMIGYMMGHALSGPAAATGPYPVQNRDCDRAVPGCQSSGGGHAYYGGSGGGGGARPVYADRDGVLRTNSGTTVGHVTPGTTSISTVRTVARGGFGNIFRGFRGGS